LIIHCQLSIINYQLTNMLSINNLIVDYGKVRALKGVSIEVKQGELVAIIGSNGAGKTTTMRTISGLLKPTEGTILYEGNNIAGIEAHKIAAMGVTHVPEGRRVFATMSIHDNLILGGTIRLRKGDKKGVADDIEKMFTVFPRLRERREQLAGTLSGGEQQMLAIARALVAKPRLLLLDEPSMGLAPVIIDEVYKLIAELKSSGDMTILLVEQLAFRALGVADRTYVLEQGRITVSGKSAELRENPDVKKAYLGASAR
jgi:branched-chain amino acid transport system ATP-binding protein